MNRFFAPGREFSLIESLFDASHFSREGQGLGDDGYVFQVGGETWAISTDMSVEGIHYRTDWADPATALEKALLSNLSDINAMGGKTSLVFMTLGALKSWDAETVARLGKTLSNLEVTHGFRVVGGDTVRKEAESFFGFTVMGRIAGKPLLRSAARPGHKIYVSGKLGGSAAGLDLFRSGMRTDAGRPWQGCIEAHLRPRPPLDLGPELAVLAQGASIAQGTTSGGQVAAIDISDGLSSELGHLSRQSGCRLVVESGKLAYVAGLPQLAAELKIKNAWMDWVLHGGEEYQLLFTGEFSESELQRLASHAEIHEVGWVKAGAGVGIVDGSGAEAELSASGWSH